MTTIRMEPYPIPAADIGSENPLPVFRGSNDDIAIDADESLTDEDRLRLGWRTAWRALPYRMQDCYNRDRRRRVFESIVLENSHLRAVILPQLGGRLVSLYHKIVGREMLSRNPVFQPANLALRNAWFSGGIEWNSGQAGHHYLTCSQVFAAEVQGVAGSPCLRLYEWDRVKGYAWQVDIHLPDNSPFLFVHIRIVNPHSYEIPMYWWTNIAVEERADIRVLTPAETAVCNPYGESLQVVNLPMIKGLDFSYPARIPHAFDFFFEIPVDRRRWIAALDRKGEGFFETSTDRLIGRKLFCWGASPGGRQWQEFLSQPGTAYIEIQAGLARTQMESVPMPPHAEWEWTEAFGPLKTDLVSAHAEDWEVAWRSVAEEMEHVIPRHHLDELDAEFSDIATRIPVRVLCSGAGWAALELRRRTVEGFPAPPLQGLVFDHVGIGSEQEPWLNLLEYGYLPERDPEDDPGAMMIQAEWRNLLEASLHTDKGDHWLAWWHLGVMRMEERDLVGAREAWETSIQRLPTGWAYRNLAVIAQRMDEMEMYCNLMRKAWDTGPHIAHLAIEYAQSLLSFRRPRELLDFITTLPEDIRAHERILLLEAKAALDTGEISDVERIFDHDFATIREGEVTLTDLWFAFQMQRVAKAEGLPIDDSLRERIRKEFPPPRRIDFRMSG